jgi:hypothetical protein
MHTRNVRLAGSSVAENVNTALGRFKAKFSGEDFGALVSAAIAEDPDAVRQLFEDAAAQIKTEANKKKEEQKVAASSQASGVVQPVAAIACYPGANNHQKAVAMLTEKLPGFSKNDRRQQLFLADRYLQTGAAV